jgi:hypothetical protein
VFSGVKLLCMGAKEKNRPYIHCLNPLIIPAEKFLKIANIKYKCPACGHSSDKLGSYFISLVKLKKAGDTFDGSGFYIRNYELAFQGCHEDGFNITPYVLQEDDWVTWNMQVASITIANTEEPAFRMDIWEDHFFKGRPFVHPFQWEMTFGSVLRRRSLYINSHEVNLSSLKNLIKELRNYNSAWLRLVDSFITAAPVDLKDSLYTHLNKVDSLVKLFPETETYE